jgi:isocitrate dehydrogenase
MIDATTASSNTDTTRNDLTHINTLVGNATDQGLKYIIVDIKIIDDTMMSDLKLNYGYKVTKFNDFNGTYLSYKIEW